MIPLGTPAPDFALVDVVHQRTLSLHDIFGTRGTMVMFICNHCPYVQHIIQELVHVAREYTERGIGFVAINSNDVQAYPDDSPEKMRDLALRLRFPFPYLYDATQETARAYRAACTPDFFLFDNTRRCVYRGQFDSARPGNSIPVTGNDIRHALDCLCSNKPNTREQIPSIGCNIKWRRDLQTHLSD
jgi:thiol-disulfide isomerase/thioredoxin